MNELKKLDLPVEGKMTLYDGQTGRLLDQKSTCWSRIHFETDSHD